MRIVAVHERTVPIGSRMSNAWLDFGDMTCSVVAVVTDVRRSGKPVIGYGFNSNGRYGQPGLLRERFIPRLLALDIEMAADDGRTIDPRRVQPMLMHNEKPGGHGERSVAVGILDMAMWDIAGKLAGLPVCTLLAQHEGQRSRDRVRAYAAGGYYDRDKGLAALRTELQGYVAKGYAAVKIKVGGAPMVEDLRRIDVAIEAAGDASRVAVDANGRFTLDEAGAFGTAIEGLGLMWYEEPVDPLDYDAHASLARAYAGPLATGENLFSTQDVRNLLRHGGLRPDRDILQMDPVLSYGLTEYLGMVAAIEEAGWERSSLIPHGGHLLNLHAAAGLHLSGIEAYPSVFQPFGGMGDQADIVDGMVTVPDAPGLGLETDARLFAILSALA